mmetsp:Transcript_13101/g.35844  ORF Transcript_13101/g.35844 Transcript_13101/m.35844 type:complete len:404 (-) Transcript_13101:84-1295(-)|eukprot:CAMPEP_0177210914 /NCGR_PEP_ID=MMETSP0367-20130122/31810_1 /TAXON_ID=447022 ORGANISM="Scrippsiella hangoei-like, Strain SHHI-4" /NCGR_SAMPLE_ID=MMETSP0367 /ASSEMBLY_ACC=CAM_ASM_000362 /LENGTH=403 /DNA_ID=CAMNT_0018660059 /DNA_START=57 /DNA_END=1268 /DNA_ORIENTATION=-
MGQGSASQSSGAVPNAAAVEEAKEKVNAMSVKELNIYLGKNMVDCSSCVEKADLVNMALKVAEKAPLAAGPVPPPKPPKGEFLCCFDFLLPKNAPDWYVRKLGGRSGASGDCHERPAPSGSLLALGHVSLAVPDGPLARAFYETGLGFNMSSHSSANEIRLNAGPSQLWLHVKEGQEADRWPGEIRVWVDNIQTTYDLMAVTDGSLGTKLVSEYSRGVNGGEFSIMIIDPFLKTFFQMTEAPTGRKESIQKIGGESSSWKSNVIAISDLSIKCRNRSETQLLAEFYKHFFGAAITIEQYSCMVHFSPGRELHQTLTFKEDPSIPPATNLGSFCFYLVSKQALHLAFVKCAAAGIVESPSTWEEAERSLEFVLKGMIDPSSGKILLPLRNIVRCAGHLDCLVFA